MKIDIIGEKSNVSVYDKRDSFGFEVFRYPSTHSNIPEKKPLKIFSFVSWLVFQGFATMWKVSIQLVDYLRRG